VSLVRPNSLQNDPAKHIKLVEHGCTLWGGLSNLVRIVEALIDRLEIARLVVGRLTILKLVIYPFFQIHQYEVRECVCQQIL
jgi:hypothetical protein